MEYHQHPVLGSISRLSLGSWNTFSRCSLEELTQLLDYAFGKGVNLLDVGYYWDKPDTEQAVAAALNQLNMPREKYLIAQKLWLWDYPENSFRQQLEASLSRLGHEHVDLVMVSRPSAEIRLDEMLAEVVSLVEAGLARSWGVTNFSAAQLIEAIGLCRANSWPMPIWQQMQYNVMRRGIVEAEDYAKLFTSGDIALCAAHIFEGGILAGHLDRDRVDPPEFARGVRPAERNIARDSGGIREEIRNRQSKLETLAATIGATAPQLAIAAVLRNPGLATALIGVTKLDQLTENLGAFDLKERLEEIAPELDLLAISGVAHPKLFNPHNDI